MSHTKATSHFQTVAIIGKHGASGIHETLLELADFLQSIGRTVIVESNTAKELKDQRLTSFDLEEICRRADLAIVVGGDGTMLGIARQLASFKVPLIGVNLGRLGFMTDIPKERMLPLLQDIFEGQLASEKRSLLEGVILRGEQMNRFVDVLLERHDLSASPRAVAGDDDARLRVEHAVDDRRRWEPAENHAVCGADAGAREHRDGEFRHHAHVERDDVALLHAERFQCVRAAANLFKEFAVAEVLHLGRAIGLRLAFPNDADFVAVTREHVAVERVVADIGLRADEPLRVGAVPREHLRPRRKPVEVLRDLGPETFRVGDRSRVARAIFVHRPAPRSAKCGRVRGGRREDAVFLQERLDVR